MLKKFTNFFFIASILYSTISSAGTSALISEIPKATAPYLAHYEHKLNAYGNLVLEIKKKTPNCITDLKNIRDIVHKEWDKRGILVYLPIALGSLGKQITALDFDLYDIDIAKQQIIYIYRNGRGIPNISTGFTSATVFIFRDNPKTHEREILVVNEYDKNAIMVPAGYGAETELAVNTAIREVQEEVGISLKREQLVVAAIRNQVSKAVDKNHVSFCFTAIVPWDTKVQIDNKEVMDYAWVPLNKLLDDNFEMFGKKFFQGYAMVLKNTSPIGVMKSVKDGEDILKVTPFAQD